MAAGKNKLLRHARVYVGGYDVSGDTRAIGNMANSFTPVMSSGIDEQIRNYQSNYRREVGITGFQAIMNDTAGRAFGLLKDEGTSWPVSVLLGGGAAPGAGDVAYMLPSIGFGNSLTWDNELSLVTADFMPDAGQAPEGKPTGRLLYPSTAISATTNGASIDDLGSSANGLHANLHVLATAAGDYEFKIQDSADDSAWADLITFTIDGSAINAEYGKATGTVDQYLRLVSTRTAGNVTVACVVARL